MKFIFDLFPILVFYAAYFYGGIFFAALCYLSASLLQLALTYWRFKKIPMMLWVSAFIICTQGGFALWLQNEMLIKLKPTVIYWTHALILLVALLAFKKNLIRNMVGEHMNLTPTIWNFLNGSWMVFLVFLGAINWYVGVHYSSLVWVNFKLFGGVGFVALFVFLQGLFLSQYIEDEAAQ